MVVVTLVVLVVVLVVVVVVEVLRFVIREGNMKIPKEGASN
jgi:phosphotransferase system  glucose/maltose/N-acetylglucosamine-specific IIC component